MAQAYTILGNIYSANATGTAADAYTNSSTRPVIVRVASAIGVHVDTNVTATVASAFIPGNTVELINVDPGKSLSVIKAASETDAPVIVTSIALV